MQKKIKKLDFSNQLISVGIDVHKKSWTVTIQIAGQQIKSFSMNPSPEELNKYLRKNYPGGTYQSVYEAGFCGYWIDRQLQRLDIKNIIVNPADVPTSNKEKTRKTDGIDSRKLARELSGKNLSGIYIPSEAEEAERILSRLRIQLTKDQTRLKNRIKSLLNFLGVHIPENVELKHWSGGFISYLHKLEFKHEQVKQTFEQLLKQLSDLRNQLSEVLKLLRKSVKKNQRAQKIVTHLLTVPGVGFITAVTLYTEIMNISRFSRFDELSSYVGLAPSTYSSGEKERVLGLGQRQNTHLRNVLIESAWVAVRKDPAITMVFGQLTKRMKKQEAIIRIAKKLLSRIMHVWKQEEDYILAVVE
jgi:transposase